MELLSLVWRQYRWPFLGVIALSLLSAALGIGLIAFINLRLITAVDTSLRVLPEFLGLLGLLMAVTLGSQLALTTLGHHFVYRLRGEFVKRILDTQIEQVEKIGSASLLAGLTSDIRNITIAFVRLPELVQGIILTFGSAAYLAWLSGKMMLVTALWMALTIWGGFVLVSRVYKHMASLRETEDKLYHDYQTVLEGRKELTLNRERAEYVFNQLYLPDAREYRHHIVRADTFHLSAVNWSNIMMLGAIGLVFWMANSLGWADTAVAATYSLTLLFLRTPLLSAVGALPTLLSAQVAFNKLRQFSLAPYRADFPRPQAHPDWQTLELRDVTFHYPDQRFAVGPLNLTLKRGELVFLIGGNGSGKSTLAMLLTGLYQPISGQILVDASRWRRRGQRSTANCFPQCLPTSGCLTACSGRRARRPIRRWWRHGWSVCKWPTSCSWRTEKSPTCGCRKGRRSAWRSCWRWPSPGTSFCWMNGRRIRIRISAASSTRSCCR